MSILREERVECGSTNERAGNSVAGAYSVPVMIEGEGDLTRYGM